MLRKTLDSGTEAFDGHANRFLWAALRNDTIDLPHGGNIDVLKPYLDRLQSALTFAKSAGEMRRDADANRLWEGVYSSLKRSGDEVPHTDRARPYVVRLSMLYALADSSNIIRFENLRAALALWDYCRESARMLFSEQSAEQEPLWLRLLNAIQNAPGISRTGLRDAVGHKIKGEDIDAALGLLERSRLAYKVVVQHEGAGRPAECWYPGPKPPDGGVMNDAAPDPAWIVQADTGAGREGINSAAAEADTNLLPVNAGRELIQGEPASGGINSLPPPAKAEADALPAAEGSGPELLIVAQVTSNFWAVE